MIPVHILKGEKRVNGYPGDRLHDKEIAGVEDRGEEGQVGLDSVSLEVFVLKEGPSAGSPDQGSEQDGGNSHHVEDLVPVSKTRKNESGSTEKS